MKASACELPEENVPMPAQWEKAVLGEFIAGIETGKSFKCLERPPEGREVGVAKVSSVTWGEYQEQESKTCQDPNRVQERFLIREGDFLFSRANTVELVGACVIAKSVTRKIMLSDKILRLKFSEVLPPFVLYYLRSKQGRDQIKLLSTGNQQSMRNIGQDRIRAIRMPVPPLAEQRRIVAKIEELFSELDKGVESLKTTRAQLKTYRQSLLKAAFEGRLTELWRDNAGKLETANQLLQHIQEEREANYSRKLENWKGEIRAWDAKGRPGSKPKKPSIPKGSDASNSHDDLADLPSLPRDWEWMRLGDIALESVLGKMLDKSKNKGNYKPYLRNINVRWGEFELDDILQMRFEDHETARYSLNDGDLVICEGGEPGRCAVWRKEYGEDMRIQKALHRVRFAPDCIDPDYVRYFILYAGGMRWLERYMTGTTIKHLTGKGLSQLPIPICSLPEQQAVTDALESKLALTDQLEVTIAINEKKIEALRQSILKRAFEGKLVPQDPDDEPASVLLERIRQEQADAPKPKRRKRKTEASA